MKALQRTLNVSKYTQNDVYEQIKSNNLDFKSIQHMQEMFSCATLERAELIINAAKRVMKRRYLKKAREVLKHKKI